MLPALTQNLQSSVKQWLTPSAEQQAEIAKAQQAETAPPAGVVQLRTKTKNALRFQEPAAAAASGS